MSLDSKAVDAIFGRMAVRYGASWLAKWNGIPMDAVKADWARELAHVSRDAIVYALGYLPLEFPPTVSQFRDICRRAPDRSPEQKRLDAPPPDPKRVAELLSKAEALRAARSPRQWARDLKAREKRGDPLTEPQRLAWRKALGQDEPSQLNGTYSPIDSRCLPPGMRPAEQDAAYERAEEFALRDPRTEEWA